MDIYFSGNIFKSLNLEWILCPAKSMWYSHLLGVEGHSVANIPATGRYLLSTHDGNKELLFVCSSSGSLVVAWWIGVSLRLLEGPNFKVHAAVMFSTSHDSKAAEGKRFGGCGCST